MNFARIFKHEDLVKHDFEVLLLDRPLAYRTEEISQASY